MRGDSLPIALAFVLTTALGEPAAATVVPPVALRTPTVLVPDEIEGSGLAPEATVRLSIDERGRVTRVEVLSITPASEYDELFRARVTETLARWRYAPQLRDGVPEATTLEWRFRFPAERAGEREERAASDDLESRLPVGGDAEQRRAAVLALPEAQRLALLAAQVKTARAVLDPRRTQHAESDHFTVWTDADSPEVARRVANDLEAIFHVLAKELLSGIEPAPEKYKIQVVVYRTRDEYAALLARMPVYEWSVGFYGPAGLIAFQLELSSNDEATSVLLHESTHAFMDRHIVRRGVALPRWLGEGFADYVGNSEVRKGRIVPGHNARGKYELWMGEVARIETGAAQRIDAAKIALRHGKGLGVRELLAASPEIFYGENRDLYYASAWLLVHFLRDGEPGWAQGRFPKALLYVAEGYPAPEVFEDFYGPLDALDAAFRRYVKSF